MINGQLRPCWECLRVKPGTRWGPCLANRTLYPLRSPVPVSSVFLCLPPTRAHQNQLGDEHAGRGRGETESSSTAWGDFGVPPHRWSPQGRRSENTLGQQHGAWRSEKDRMVATDAEASPCGCSARDPVAAGGFPRAGLGVRPRSASLASQRRAQPRGGLRSRSCVCGSNRPG